VNKNVFVQQMIIRLPSDITSCCMTDVKAESSLNTGGLFCSTSDGRIFAIQLSSYLYVVLIVDYIFALQSLSVVCQVSLHLLTVIPK